VTLTRDSDVLGMQRLNVDWRYTPLDVRTVGTAVGLFAQDVATARLGVFEYDPDSIELEMSRYGAYGGHHLGTARMGTDPRVSVVDGNGCVHGLSNLYIAGSAVFPTSSQANPTLTIVALAARLAAHLRLRAAAPAPSVGGATPSAGGSGQSPQSRQSVPSSLPG
jgi:choline dehydrogenase-like flavoprotein